jgi:glutathione S-transferase
MESAVTLYAFPRSHCSQKVRLALAEKQVAYANRFVDIEMRLQN